MNIIKRFALSKELNAIGDELMRLSNECSLIEPKTEGDIDLYAKEYPLVFSELISDAERMYDLSVREYEIFLELGAHDFAELIQLETINETLYRYKQAQACVA